ncbi:MULTISPECIES: diphthine synthase [Haloferax]|uniref:Diphthine synthase n=2 Tax=Haloferax TaxID=2251 RepID=A0A6G1Z5A1_9EURY|nr:MULTISPECIES: diphthine synthase [Haloferax]KAB1189013.1 diphthine synthase [Haloferax sp. CBA1149]MRW81739.1 diphthine synthase [Haloferax marinisediminis]
MLTFIGLGLFDERSISVEGREALADADRAFAEFYTSHLVGATVEDLETYHDIDIEVRDRAGVEQDPEEILAAAEEEHVAFLTAGDTMISTTHVDLRLRAEARGIETHLIHGVTAQSAASGLTGLQNYRFGKAVTLPFPYVHGGDPVPKSVVDSLEANRERGLHTLVYLDIKVDWEGRRGVEVEGDQYMTADYAAELFAEHWDGDALGVAVCRAGSREPVVAADRLSELAKQDFGDPLHMLIIPGEVHHVEADALMGLGGAPEDLFDYDER